MNTIENEYTLMTQKYVATFWRFYTFIFLRGSYIWGDMYMEHIHYTANY